MEIQTEMAVLDRDDEPLGTVEKIIFEPYRSDVLGIVVGSGLLRPRRVLNLQHVTGSEPLVLKTDLSQAQFQCLDRFREADFRRPPGSWAPPNGWLQGDIRYPAPPPAYPVAAPLPTPHVDFHPALDAGSTMTAPDSDPAGAIEELWEESHDNRFKADPYDVLNGPVVSCCHTQYEWDEASMINPLPRPPESGGRP